MVTVSELHRFHRSPDGRTGFTSGWAAEATLDDGSRVVVSRYDAETDWVADGLYTAACTWFPVYWNGEGSRCTRLRVVSDEVAVALNNAVVAATPITDEDLEFLGRAGVQPERIAAMRATREARS